VASPAFLPYGRQWLDDDDIAAVVAVLRSDWLTQGPAVEAFERALAARVGAAYAIACANGTAALHLAALALDLVPGDAVVVPAVTFVATANVVRHAGAEVAFADVDPATGLMGPDHVLAAVRRAEAAGGRVRAVIPVHFAGQTVDIAALGALARERNLAVIEDACHALGAESTGTGGVWSPVGGCAGSVMTAFSFHPVKTIAAGEGGAVTTNDAALARRLRRLRNHGLTRERGDFTETGQAFASDGTANPWYYELPEPGFNYRLTDIQSALALSQLGKLDRFVARRRDLVDFYDGALASLAPGVLPPVRVSGCRPAWHLYCARVDFVGLGRERAGVMAALRDRGVGSQVHYIPVHRQPYYRRRYGDLALPGAEAHYARALSLPLYPAMSDDAAARVVEAVFEILS
jgi:UDP-4-amino-4,6-dideoxy-N-acetyl-beta-L-altrosamine transaminase